MKIHSFFMTSCYRFYSTLNRVPTGANSVYIKNKYNYNRCFCWSPRPKDVDSSPKLRPIEFFDPNPIAGPLFIKGTYTNGTAITKDIVAVEGKLIPTFGPDRPINCEITDRNVFECIGEVGTSVIPLNNQIRVGVTSN